MTPAPATLALVPEGSHSRPRRPRPPRPKPAPPTSEQAAACVTIVEPARRWWVRSRTRPNVVWAAWLDERVIRCACEAGQVGSHCWHRGAVWSADRDLRRLLGGEDDHEDDHEGDPEEEAMSLRGAVPMAAEVADLIPDLCARCGAEGADRPGPVVSLSSGRTEQRHVCEPCWTSMANVTGWDDDEGPVPDVPFGIERLPELDPEIDAELDLEDPADDEPVTQGEGRRDYAVRAPVPGLVRLSSLAWSAQMAVIAEMMAGGHA